MTEHAYTNKDMVISEGSSTLNANESSSDIRKLSSNFKNDGLETNDSSTPSHENSSIDPVSKKIEKTANSQVAAQPLSRSDKRRLTYGDKPYWFQKDNQLSENERFLLGCSGAITLPFARKDPKNHSIRLTEVVPNDNRFIEDDAGNRDWRVSIEKFTSKLQGSIRRRKSSQPKRIRSYYKKQDELIKSFEEIRLQMDDMRSSDDMEKLRKQASRFAKATFLVNIFLLIIKIVAVVLSGSISLVSSLVDSAVDLMSGLIIWVTSRAVKKRDPYIYPQGRTKLEPLAIVILSVIMSIASLQLIKESVTKIINLHSGAAGPPVVDFITIGISSITVVAKFILYLLCRRVIHPTIQALAQDHRNDVLSNSVAILCGYLGSVDMQKNVTLPELFYIDPIGAIIISAYIAGAWWKTGYGQIKLLTGKTAKPEFLSQITWLCVNHHRKIECVDTVRAFHFGNHFLVEVDIVLPQDMTLKEAHDIGEPLQQKLENLPKVERAFVHIDYETTHDPKSEHKIV